MGSLLVKVRFVLGLALLMGMVEPYGEKGVGEALRPHTERSYRLHVPLTTVELLLKVTPDIRTLCYVPIMP